MFRRLKVYKDYVLIIGMKLQKRFLREVNKKKYYKFMINIPPELVEKAKFKEGDELEGKAEKNKIVLRKK